MVLATTTGNVIFSKIEGQTDGRTESKTIVLTHKNNIFLLKIYFVNLFYYFYLIFLNAWVLIKNIHDFNQKFKLHILITNIYV